jgi:hypothetical protein
MLCSTFDFWYTYAHIPCQLLCAMNCGLLLHFDHIIRTSYWSHIPDHCIHMQGFARSFSKEMDTTRLSPSPCIQYRHHPEISTSITRTSNVFSTSSKSRTIWYAKKTGEWLLETMFIWRLTIVPLPPPPRLNNPCWVICKMYAAQNRGWCECAWGIWIFPSLPCFARREVRLVGCLTFFCGHVNNRIIPKCR